MPIITDSLNGLTTSGLSVYIKDPDSETWADVTSDGLEVQQLDENNLHVISHQEYFNDLEVEAFQPTASGLNSTVWQDNFHNLEVEAFQPTASGLNTTVWQGTASNLNATVVQATATNLNANVSQATAGNLNATVVQSTASNLKAEVDLKNDYIAQVGNAPASPGQVLDVTDDLSHEVTVADLTVGTKYQLMVLPWDLSVAPGTPTDFVRGVYKCAAAAGSIASLEDGEPIFSNVPVPICLPTSSTKVRVYFMRDDQTPFDCKIYLSVKSS